MVLAIYCAGQGSLSWVLLVVAYSLDVFAERATRPGGLSLLGLDDSICEPQPRPLAICPRGESVYWLFSILPSRPVKACHCECSSVRVATALMKWSCDTFSMQTTEYRLIAAVLVAAMMSCAAAASAQTGADFDDLPLVAESYWNGADLSGQFTSGAATLFNSYNAAWGTWDGWSYSNRTDTTTPGYSNEYSGADGRRPRWVGELRCGL